MREEIRNLISNEVSKSLLRLDSPLSGLEILSAISKYSNAEDAMLYALMGAGIIKANKSGKTIRDYEFLIDKKKVKSRDLMNSLIFERKSEKMSESKFKLVAGFPAEKEFTDLKGLESLYPMLCRLIISAESQIFMANPFFDNSGIRKILPYLIKASERGVKLKIISRKPRRNERGQNNKLESIVNKLGKKCEVRCFGGSLHGKPYFLHAKFLISDDKMAYIGSANITETSLGNNIEIGAIVENECVKSLKKFFELVWEKSI